MKIKMMVMKMGNVKQLQNALLVTAGSILFQSSALSHHGTAGQFDASRVVEVSGVITNIAYVNPHSYVYFDVEAEDGQVKNWNCELRSSSILNRSGWSVDMFSTGTEVDIVGVPARRDPEGCYVETISFNGGPAIERYAQLEEGQFEVNTARPNVTSWGDPNFSGYWAAEQRLYGVISNTYSGDDNGLRADGQLTEAARLGGVGMLQLTEAGQAAKDAVIGGDDSVTGRLDCSPRNFYNDWTFDQLTNEIIQDQDKIILKQGFMSTERTIYLGMEEHPEDLEPSWNGHSIGYWQGDTLVVDTIGFTEFITVGGARSNQFRATETFILDTERGAIVRTYEGEDPLYWPEKQTGEQIVFLTDYPYEPYGCDDRAFE